MDWDEPDQTGQGVDWLEIEALETEDLDDPQVPGASDEWVSDLIQELTQPLEPPPYKAESNTARIVEDERGEELPLSLPSLQPDQAPDREQDLVPAWPDPPVEPKQDARLEGEVGTTVFPPSPLEPVAKVWYLAIDFGTTGISAVLFNRLTTQMYPIYWAEKDLTNPEQTFRLPAVVSFNIAPEQPDFLLRDFKSFLKLGIPHYSSAMARWEPVLQWSEQIRLPLTWVYQALQGLLATLSGYPTASASSSTLTCNAVGLEPSEFQPVLQQLAGVIVGYPANWPDTYTFNLREAIVGARLVAHPEQILFLEDAIATVLAALHGTGDGDTAAQPERQTAQISSSWQGKTLVLQAGATVTELALIDLPPFLHTLHHTDVHIRSVPYAGNSIDQDIIAQLFHPLLIRPQGFEPLNVRLGLGTVDLSLDMVTPENLGLDAWILPTPGIPDLPNRYRFQQQLESPAGQLLLDAARYLKLAFQDQSRLTVQLGQQTGEILRQDMASQVLLPYVQRLNRELNTLLTQTETTVLDVKQVICTGGTASLGAIARWLRQKLPNATIVQDTYPGQEHCISSCSRIAYGLATAPLYPNVVNLPRQQFNDYFLLLELLRVVPDRPITLSELLPLLDQRGIDTDACYLHILALLEGHLPPGLVPTEQEANLFTAESRQNPDYQAIQLAPLFYKQPDQTYYPNRHQWTHLRRYLDSLMTNTHQTLGSPLMVSLEG